MYSQEESLDKKEQAANPLSSDLNSLVLLANMILSRQLAPQPASVVHPTSLNQLVSQMMNRPNVNPIPANLLQGSNYSVPKPAETVKQHSVRFRFCLDTNPYIL